MKNKLLIAFLIFSIFVHSFFYISAHWTHTLNIFFENVTRGQDFFQIPNAAYSLLHGGSLTGVLPEGKTPYTTCCGVNNNVYHPLFTLIVGIPLQFFPPWTAYGIWTFAHILITGITIFFLWSKFKTHKYIYLALSLFLLNSYHYYEIQHAQYHFLFNFFTILFMYEAVKKGDSKKAGIFLFLSLLVKPIGLLWILPLLLYKHFKTVALGFGLYAIATLIFNLFPFGQYYLSNFTSVAHMTFPTYNLLAVLNIYPSIPANNLKLLSYLTGGALVAFQIIKKPNLFTVIALWSMYQLLFYSLTFPYHYTAIAGIICLGILFGAFSPKRLSFAPIILLTLPTPTIFYHLAGLPPALPPKEYSIIALYSAVLILVLAISLLLNPHTKKVGS